jgi:hypothetical protein
MEAGALIDAANFYQSIFEFKNKFNLKTHD